MTTIDHTTELVLDALADAFAKLNDERPRLFLLHRLEDVSGVTGTGVVAEGVEFTDGQVAVNWASGESYPTAWPSLAALLDVHGHGGRTEVVWL